MALTLNECPDGVTCRDECHDGQTPTYCARTGQMSDPFNVAHEYEMHYCSDHRGGPDFCNREAVLHVYRVATKRSDIMGEPIPHAEIEALRWKPWWKFWA